MNIFLTYDYELFFGVKPGTVQKCLLDPTRNLLHLAKEFNAPMTFFVDVGFLMKLEDAANLFPALKQEFDAVVFQLEEILISGSDIQLHIHPHWEKSFYSGSEWIINTSNCYKLEDFSDDEAIDIIVRYKEYLEKLIGRSVHTFRAGGWCIQPFERWSQTFKSLGIKYDTSVFPGGQFQSEHYAFDFRKAPKKSYYKFENDVCKEDENGFFTEYPISSMRYSPLFYWRLYILGRLFPLQHKMLGDGIFLSQPGRKKSVLTNFTWNHLSTDGYYVSKLPSALSKMKKLNYTDAVVIGHPKSNTNFSVQNLRRFLKKNQSNYTFKTFGQLP